jgi:hypothetical protein
MLFREDVAVVRISAGPCREAYDDAADQPCRDSEPSPRVDRMLLVPVRLTKIWPRLREMDH